MAFIVAPGQAHELPHAIPLLDRLPGVPKWVVGDRGYASHAFRQHVWERGARPAIPTKRNEAPVACPDWIYNNRNMVQHRAKPGAARRELEDLRAAIKYHRSEGLCREVVEVVLPEKGEARDRWLTRSEAARLIWAAWRYREVQKGIETDRRSRRHVARFILVGLYTGTRAGAICAAALEPTEGSGWIDLERGVFYRRPKGERETKKRKPPVRLPVRPLAISAAGRPRASAAITSSSGTASP